MLSIFGTSVFISQNIFLFLIRWALSPSTSLETWNTAAVACQHQHTRFDRSQMRGIHAAKSALCLLPVSWRLQRQEWWWEEAEWVGWMVIRCPRWRCYSSSSSSSNNNSWRCRKSPRRTLPFALARLMKWYDQSDHKFTYGWRYFSEIQNFIHKFTCRELMTLFESIFRVTKPKTRCCLAPSTNLREWKRAMTCRLTCIRYVKFFFFPVLSHFPFSSFMLTNVLTYSHSFSTNLGCGNSNNNTTADEA